MIAVPTRDCDGVWRRPPRYIPVSEQKVALTTGTRLGAYEILTRLGSGGLGEVYRATDVKLQRDVAVKVLPQPLRDDPERVARFEREAQHSRRSPIPTSRMYMASTIRQGCRRSSWNSSRARLWLTA